MRSRQPFYRSSRRLSYVQLDGKQINLGPDEKEAWRRYHGMMTARGVEVEVAPVDASLCVVVVDQFLGWVEKRKSPRTYEWYRRHLRNLAAAIPRSLAVADLKPNHVTRIIDAHDGWSPSSKHGFAGCVQRAFRWAVQEGLINRSPVAGLVKPESEARDVVISAAEYAAILGVVRESNLRDLIVAAWETGARPRELVTVEARHVQLEHGRWVFPKKQAKGKRQPRAVYLTAAALEITRGRMEAHPAGPIFRNADGRPWHRWAINCAFARTRVALGRKAMQERGIAVEELPRFRKSRVAAGELAAAKAEQAALLKARRAKIARLALENAPAYNLGAFRHSFGDRMLKAGVDPISVANLLGHRNLAMLANTYSHLNQDPAYLRDALTRGKGEGP